MIVTERPVLEVGASPDASLANLQPAWFGFVRETAVKCCARPSQAQFTHVNEAKNAKSAFKCPKAREDAADGDSVV
jgi:hypothetical protein